MKKSNFLKRVLGMTLLCGLFAFAVRAQEPVKTEDLLDLSFEDLLNMEITSVSKKAERLQDVPSSIYVLTADQIHRSSAQNLVQLLREHVPGFWAVFNDYKNSDAFIRNTTEGSLLVLLDGTPMFDLLSSSFENENFDIPFDMINRIEVIKGSGGTVYGANSATGVISIFTKNAAENKTLLASASYSMPGQVEASLVATPVKGEKLQASVFGKYSSFSGFDQMAETVNSTSVVPKTFSTGDTTITNRYTKDDNKYTSMAFGYHASLAAGNNLTLSSALNFSAFRNDRYNQVYPPENASFQFTGDPANPDLTALDEVNLIEYKKNRIVGNIRADYSFSNKHNLFVRAATNAENADQTFGGGFNARNSIIDFEIQDNIEIGSNQLSIGGNYRMVNINLSDFVESSQMLYVNETNSQNLKGLFIQDKISLFEGMLNLYLGIKTENYSLINDKFYWSPMAKFSFVPSENFTLWGGYSKSYTTPGYNQTNIEFNFFRAESPAVFYNYTLPMVQMGVYQQVYEAALAMGADEATADAQAQGYLQTPEGQYVVDSVTNQSIAMQAAAYPGHFNVAAINGPNTVPSSFKNFDIGIRLKPMNNLSVESNFFYTIKEDGVTNSPAQLDRAPSLVHDGEYIDAYYYGNYLRGYNTGLESVIKYAPVTGLMLELSHAWFKNYEELQENNDFDIDELTDSQRDLVDEDFPKVPKHTFRAKVNYDLNDDWQFSVSTMYATSFYVKFGTLHSTYQYEQQRFDPLFSDGGNQSLIGGKHDNRLMLNFRIDKYFLNKKLNVFLYGYDVTSSPFTEGIWQLEIPYPRQVGGMIGAGLSYVIE